MYLSQITRFFSALFLLVALASWSLSCWAAEWRRWRLSGILLTLSSGVPLRTGVSQSCFVCQHFSLAGPVPFLRVWVLTWKIRWCPLWASCVASADVSLEHLLGITWEKKSAVYETGIPEPCARPLCCTSSSSPSNMNLALFPCYRGSDRIEVQNFLRSFKSLCLVLLIF